MHSVMHNHVPGQCPIQPQMLYRLFMQLNSTASAIKLVAFLDEGFMLLQTGGIRAV